MPEEGATFTAKVMKLGRLTVPESVRDLLKIAPGDIVEVKIQKRTPAND
jgi:AbrB family looped-hinge helix DNA binding protein